MIKTEQDFIDAVGSEPERDDLERASCVEAGKAGHHQCGWCLRHDEPRFVCGCLKWLRGSTLKNPTTPMSLER